MSDLVKRKEALLRKIETRKEKNQGLMKRLDKGVALEVVFLFDTTGSMEPYLVDVQVNIKLLIGEIKRRVPNARLGVIVYKDHDQGNYVTKSLPLTDREDELVNFLLSSAVEPGKGGGGPEAVECALYEANRFNWSPGNKGKAIVLIGDKPPHGVTDAFSECPLNRDYRAETEKLIQQKVKIYSVLCNNIAETRENFQWFADKTGGKFVTLEEIHDLVDFLVAVCIREANPLMLKSYIDELKQKGILSESKRKLLDHLK